MTVQILCTVTLPICSFAALPGHFSKVAGRCFLRVNPLQLNKKPPAKPGVFHVRV